MINFITFLFIILTIISSIFAILFLLRACIYIDSYNFDRENLKIIVNFLLFILFIGLTFYIGIQIDALRKVEDSIPQCEQSKKELERINKEDDILKVQIHDDFIMIYKLLNTDRSIENLQLKNFTDANLKHQKNILDNYLIENNIELTSWQKDSLDDLNSHIKEHYENMKDIRSIEFEIDQYQSNILVKHYCN